MRYLGALLSLLVVGTLVAHAGTLPPTCVLQATRTTITQGSYTTLVWNTGSATAAALSTVGNVATMGSRIVAPSVTTTYQLYAANVYGSCSQPLTISVVPPVSTPAITTTSSSSWYSWIPQLVPTMNNPYAYYGYQPYSYGYTTYTSYPNTYQYGGTSYGSYNGTRSGSAGYYTVDIYDDCNTPAQCESMYGGGNTSYRSDSSRGYQNGSWTGAGNDYQYYSDGTGVDARWGDGWGTFPQ